jgi:C4-dicarboxylate-binding protein DctP
MTLVFSSSSSTDTAAAGRMVTDIPATHVRVPYFRRMAAQLDAAGLACRLEIDGQRYAGRAALDAVRAGQARAAWVNAAHLEPLDPALGVLNLPFFLGDQALAPPGRADAALQLVDAVTSAQGLRALGLMRGADQLFVAPRPLGGGPGALAGLRVRVAGPGVYEAIMQSLDAAPVAVPIPHIRQALAGGALDALFTSPGGWQDQLGLDAPHALRVPGLMRINYVMLADAGWFDALPAAAQSNLRSAAQRCVTHEWQAMARDDEEVLARMEKAGARIVQAHDLELWRERVAPMKGQLLARYRAAGVAFGALAGSL